MAGRSWLAGPQAGPAAYVKPLLRGCLIDIVPDRKAGGSERRQTHSSSAFLVLWVRARGCLPAHLHSSSTEPGATRARLGFTAPVHPSAPVLVRQ